ncbi:flavin reductase family protein [Chitinibacteraceae bacterium HSL-7]
MRCEVPLDKAYLLMNHGPVTLVSSAAGGVDNVMAASWTMPLDFDPPKVAVVIDSQTRTRALVTASGEFVINIPASTQHDAVLAAGHYSGQNVDKFAQCGLGKARAAKVAAPLVEGCLAWLECKVLPRPDNETRHDLFLAEVVAAWADDSVFSHGRWHFSEDGPTSLHYLAGGQFFMTGTPLHGRMPEEA